MLSCFTGVVQNATPTWTQNIPTEQTIECRRHIHQNPELSFKEVKTSNYVADVLKSLGNIEVQRPTPTSVIGVLRGNQPGKTVAFRADIDALPIQEETGLPFASKLDGVSHACGHDVHTALLLGTATTLFKMQKDIRGTVYFVFQHAEEQLPGGAQDIINSGALKGIEAIFAAHDAPNFPAGHIGILPKESASTAGDVFFLTIQGKGSHGSLPHLGVDPVLVGAEIVTVLQTIVSHNVPPGEMVVVSIDKFHAGEAPNVIPDKAELAGTIRTVTESTHQLIADRIKTIVDSIARANNATYKLDYDFGYPSVHNDAELVDLARASAIKILGTDQVADAPRLMESEDFARYKDVAPQCLLILGVGDGFAPHHPKFNPMKARLAMG